VSGEKKGWDEGKAIKGEPASSAEKKKRNSESGFPTKEQCHNPQKEKGEGKSKRERPAPERGRKGVQLVVSKEKGDTVETYGC